MSIIKKSEEKDFINGKDSFFNDFIDADFYVCRQ